MKMNQNCSLTTKIVRLFIVLALPLINMKSALAIVQVENLSSQPGVNSTIIGDTRGFGVFDIGSSFTTDNNSYNLNSVSARLENLRSDISPENIVINLYTDSSGLPGTIIEPLNTTSDILSGSFNNYLFTSSNSVSLSPNTTYWLIGSSDSEAYNWSNTNNLETGNWTIGNGLAFSTDGGNTWGSNSQTVQFSVDADVASAAVPFEFSPAMGLLLMGGLFGGKAAYEKYKASQVKL